MALDVESIWDALATRLRDEAADLKSVDRRRKASYLPEELPCLVLADDEGDESLISETDDPGPIWRLNAQLEVYARTDDLGESPTTQLNALILGVRQALEFDPAKDATVYGGRVEHYTSLGGRVSGLALVRVEKGQGALTGKPTAQITITMEALG